MYKPVPPSFAIWVRALAEAALSRNWKSWPFFSLFEHSIFHSQLRSPSEPHAISSPAAAPESPRPVPATLACWLRTLAVRAPSQDWLWRTRPRTATPLRFESRRRPTRALTHSPLLEAMASSCGVPYSLLVICVYLCEGPQRQLMELRVV